jgi:hypothetical protein
MAKKRDESSNDWDQIEIGDQVKHAKWGVGTVLFRSGNGESAKAIVVFPEEGQKKLMLKYAGLIKVGSTSLKSVEKLKAEAEAEARPKSRAKAKPRPKPKAAVAVAEDDGADEEVDLGLGKLETDDDEEEVALDDDEDVAGFDDDEEGEFAAGKDGAPE